MNSNNAQKPEYVLKRANDYGTSEKDKKLALDLLHNFIGSKRKLAQWSKVYETIMKKHVELCVDLKNHHFAKDGLHQYRNLCQLLDPASLEAVILHLLDLTEARATAAKQRANLVALAAAAKISDLDQEESPESIMLSSMTEEGDRERTNREIVVPWLKFLWETYRAVLELLHKIPKLEKVYHKTCEKAFRFCQDYDRKLEFRRLCDMLRLHLAALQRTAVTPVAARGIRPSWEWTPETVELHLQTRFQQLEVSTALELWNEGFRTVEDIYSIMVSGRRSPKPRLMSVYYEKLTRIFWVSENYLFHAYAWFRYYSLVSEFRKELKTDERRILASCVLLSALTVPAGKDTDSVATQGVDEDDLVAEKHQQMATLLDFQANPTRKALIADIVSKGVLEDVLPELAGLFSNLEVKFHPLNLVKSVTAAIAHLKTIPQLAVYAVPLQRVIVMRVVQQLSKVYDVVKINFVRKLLEGLTDITPIAIEKIVIDGVIRKQLQLRIDHVSQCIRFGTPQVEAATFESQLTVFGTRVNEVNRLINNNDVANADARKELFGKVLETADADHAAASDRKFIIERRKIEIERIQEERERIAALIAAREEEQRAIEAAARIKAARDLAAKEKIRAVQDKEDAKRVRIELAKYNVTMTDDEIAVLTVPKRHLLIEEAKEAVVKAKEDHERKVNKAQIQLDHVTRALRIEAGAIARQRREEAEREARIKQEAQMKTFLDEHKVLHENKLLEKKRCGELLATATPFEAAYLQDQRVRYEAYLKTLKANALKDYRERKVATARRMLDEELQRQQDEADLEAERIEKEESDRIQRELDEKVRRQRQEIEAAERAKELEAQERVKELERLRQEKQLEQKQALSQQQAAKPATTSRPEPAGSGGGWRDSASKPKRDFGFGDGPRRDAGDAPRRDFGSSDGPRRDFGFGDGPRRDAGDAPRRDFGSSDGPRRDFGFGDGPRRDAGDAPRRDFGSSDGPRRDFGASSAAKPDEGSNWRGGAGASSAAPRRDFGFGDSPAKRDGDSAPRRGGAGGGFGSQSSGSAKPDADGGSWRRPAK